MTCQLIDLLITRWACCWPVTLTNLWFSVACQRNWLFDKGMTAIALFLHLSQVLDVTEPNKLLELERKTTILRLVASARPARSHHPPSDFFHGKPFRPFVSPVRCTAVQMKTHFPITNFEAKIKNQIFEP